MFNRTENSYHGGDTIINGVNAPEAASLLHDLEKEGSERIDKVIFGRIDTPDIKIMWAAAHQRSMVKNCHQVMIYYKDGEKRKVVLDLIEVDVERFTQPEEVMKAIAKNMAERITQELILKMFPMKAWSNEDTRRVGA
jgi:hypothetical protein